LLKSISALVGYVIKRPLAGLLTPINAETVGLIVGKSLFKIGPIIVPVTAGIFFKFANGK
jgi:hypothetical protein